MPPGAHRNSQYCSGPMSSHVTLQVSPSATTSAAVKPKPGERGGAAHELLRGFSTRIEALLIAAGGGGGAGAGGVGNSKGSKGSKGNQGEVVRRSDGVPVFHVLWEQDTWKDLIESAAFELPPSTFRASETSKPRRVAQSYRHVLYHAALSPPELQPIARKMRWRRDPLLPCSPLCTAGWSHTVAVGAVA